jgi:hypothetical protein
MTKNEKTVSDYLKAIGAWWEFERAVYLQDECGRPRVWCPDFYLPELGIYIEVMGPNGNYEYRQRIYDLNRIDIIFVSPITDQYWTNKIKDGIWNIHNGRYILLQQITARAKELR